MAIYVTVSRIVGVAKVAKQKLGKKRMFYAARKILSRSACGGYWPQRCMLRGYIQNKQVHGLMEISEVRYDLSTSRIIHHALRYPHPPVSNKDYVQRSLPFGPY